jgi:hypothetical protein
MVAKSIMPFSTIVCFALKTINTRHI